MPLAAVFDTNLSPAALRVLAVLSGYVDASGFCYPSMGTIARRLGCGRRIIVDHIEKLAALGYVERHHRTKIRGGGKAPNIYRVMFPPVPAMPDLPGTAEAQDCADEVEDTAPAGEPSEAPYGAPSAIGANVQSDDTLHADNVQSHDTLPVENPSPGRPADVQAAPQCAVRLHGNVQWDRAAMCSGTAHKLSQRYLSQKLSSPDDVAHALARGADDVKAFTGETVALTAEEYREWRGRFPELRSDLDAWLADLDIELSGLGKRHRRRAAWKTETVATLERVNRRRADPRRPNPRGEIIAALVAVRIDVQRAWTLLGDLSEKRPLELERWCRAAEAGTLDRKAILTALRDSAGTTDAAQ